MKLRDPIPLWAKVIWSLCLVGCLGYAFLIAVSLPPEPAVVLGFLWVAAMYIFFIMVPVSVIIAIIIRLLRGESLDDDANSSDGASLIP